MHAGGAARRARADRALRRRRPWLKVMHVNVNAAFILTQALLPLLRLSAGRIGRLHDQRRVGARAAPTGAPMPSRSSPCEGLMQVLADETDTTTHDPRRTA
ncbi:MAG: hypothetical protein MZV65_49215 [Chromatiales bacterium]|nr:hypothetical protein [Chromatiales bacterium]